MGDCVRAVWLELDGDVVQLHDEAAGQFVTELDLGSPDVREVTNKRADAHGLDDRTQFLGGRIVSVSVTALEGAGAQIDALLDLVGPYMLPDVRPTMHYVLDRPGAVERTLELRGSAFVAKINDAYQRDAQLSWLAADPVARDPNGQSATAWSGASGGVAGRVYDLRYDRVYPAGSSSPAPATLNTPGHFSVRPLLRIYGPITGARVAFVAGASPSGTFGLVPSYVIAAAHYVLVDSNARTAYLDGDPKKSVLTSVDWAAINAAGGWPILLPNTPTQMRLSGTSTTGATQVVATWNDGYLA